jgi:hypothetical protein
MTNRPAEAIPMTTAMMIEEIAKLANLMEGDDPLWDRILEVIRGDGPADLGLLPDEHEILLLGEFQTGDGIPSNVSMGYDSCGRDPIWLARTWEFAGEDGNSLGYVGEQKWVIAPDGGRYSLWIDNDLVPDDIGVPLSKEFYAR